MLSKTERFYAVRNREILKNFPFSVEKLNLLTRVFFYFNIRFMLFNLFGKEPTEGQAGDNADTDLYTLTCR